MSYEGMPHKVLAVTEPGGELQLVGCVQDHGIDDAKTLRDATFLAAPAFAVGLWARHLQYQRIKEHDAGHA